MSLVLLDFPYLLLLLFSDTLPRPSTRPAHGTRARACTPATAPWGSDPGHLTGGRLGPPPHVASTSPGDTGASASVQRRSPNPTTRHYLFRIDSGPPELRVLLQTCVPTDSQEMAASKIFPGPQRHTATRCRPLRRKQGPAEPGPVGTLWLSQKLFCSWLTPTGDGYGSSASPCLTAAPTESSR